MISNNLLLFSVVFKCIAMVIGVFGNVTVIIYAIFVSKEKTATSYLVGNLAVADLLVCLTFHPIWIIEFIQNILNIDGHQILFCKLGRSTIWAFVLASTLTLVAITVDRYLYIVKPLKYPMIVTRRRVFLTISGIWVIACCLLIVLQFYYTDRTLRSYCYIPKNILWAMNIFIGYFPVILIFTLNIRILNVARKQQKRLLAETSTHVIVNNSNEQPSKRLTGILRIIVVLKATKTFSIVVAVFAFCVLIPTVVGITLKYSCSKSCLHLWFVIFHYEFYGVNSIVNAFIYGMRHIKYRKAYKHILLKTICCNKRKTDTSIHSRC
jgi:hypothetical protein